MPRSASSPVQRRRRMPQGRGEWGIILRRTLLYVVLPFLVVGAVARKAVQFTIEPWGEKACPPLDPVDAQPLDAAGLPVALSSSGVSLAQRGGTVNDASCLSETAVYGVVRPKDVAQITAALEFARANKLPVSIAGVRHSMGGHAFSRGALVLDMRDFKQMTLDESAKLLTVQSGAVWHDIQAFLHGKKLSVKAMQSTDIFTVGGSISVNAHGMDHNAGAVVDTLRSMRLMLADGSIRVLSREDDPDLFWAAVGGYGMFGVILDATLELTDDVLYRHETRLVDYRDYPAEFGAIADDADVGLHYAHLSTAPGAGFLRETLLHVYRKTETQPETLPPLPEEPEGVALQRFMLNFSKTGWIGRKLKWWAEKRHVAECDVTRTAAMAEGEACLVTRNETMHDSVPYLRNAIPGDTDILHEYFVPREEFVAYIDDVREVLERHDAGLLNASVRAVHGDNTLLRYAADEAFSLVLYVNQGTTAEDNARMRALTGDLIDAALKHKGTFFLPYQLHYSAVQLAHAYPAIDRFFRLKREIDPQELFQSKFWRTYEASFRG